MNIMEELSWYAVYTKARWEKKVAERFTAKNIENYCPLNKVLHRWHDRKKMVLEPLFKSYVFVRISYKDRIRAKETDGVLNFVTWLGKPAIIRDEEIETIRDFLCEHMNVKVASADLAVNDKVRIESGPFMSHEGSVVEIKSKTVKVLLPSLRVALYAEIDKSNICKT